MAVIAKVAVQAAPYAIDKVYDYLLPQDMAAQVGCRVLVPFGRGNRSSEALILSLGVGVPDKPLKTVRSLLDEEPVVSDKEIRLALWMRQRYFCTFYDALHTILPAAVWYRYRELWRMADGVLLVVRPGVTTIQSAQLSKKNLEAVNAHILGVVMNGYNGKQSGRRDGYSYAYSYSYYDEDKKGNDA